MISPTSYIKQVYTLLLYNCQIGISENRNHAGLNEASNSLLPVLSCFLNIELGSSRLLKPQHGIPSLAPCFTDPVMKDWHINQQGADAIKLEFRRGNVLEKQIIPRV